MSNGLAATPLASSPEGSAPKASALAGGFASSFFSDMQVKDMLNTTYFSLLFEIIQTAGHVDFYATPEDVTTEPANNIFNFFVIPFDRFLLLFLLHHL